MSKTQTIQPVTLSKIKISPGIQKVRAVFEKKEKISEVE